MEKYIYLLILGYFLLFAALYLAASAKNGENRRK